jgi:iron-sulfur cluster assembly protein
MITVTENARQKAIALRAAEGREDGAALRVGVQGGGCSGFQYLLEFDDRRDDDIVLEEEGLTVVLDPFSAPLLKGSVLDYDASLTGRGFEFRNPQVASGAACGCGKSFQVNPEALEALS